MKQLNLFVIAILMSISSFLFASDTPADAADPIGDAAIVDQAEVQEAPGADHSDDGFLASLRDKFNSIIDEYKSRMAENDAPAAETETVVDSGAETDAPDPKL